MNYATDGNGEAVYREVEQYLNIAFFKDKIESIFNISYINEIDNALEETQGTGESSESIKSNSPKSDESKTIDWYGTLEQYVEMFGKNDELNKLIAPHKKILEIYNKIPTDNKKEIAFLKTIMIYVD